MFVTVRKTTHYDIGKLLGTNGAMSEVAYFESPTQQFLAEEVPSTKVRACKLPEQTRVFCCRPDTGIWQVGRVLEHLDGQVYVRFPNKNEESLAEKDVHVRRRIPIADPTDFLAAKVNETPLFGSTRSAFVRSITTQRTRSGGLTGLLSSSIELEPHQVKVVRRVVQDPIQRYLLADEVGMGKTIEAGVLIRQYVLDDPISARILVLVPDALVAQWRHELSTKLNLRDALDNTIHVLSYSNPEALKALGESPGMIVADEAHYLSGIYDSSSGQRWVLYEAIRTACKRAQRVLLLTATPVMRDEVGFLAVLHLLDPVLYDLNDRQGFRDKIIARKQVAELVGLFQPENALFLADEIANLRAMFPNDELLSDLLDNLAKELESIDLVGDATALNAIARVQSHLSETYRLHRRILRNRRGVLEDLSPGRAGLTICEFEDGAIGHLYAQLDNWRVWVASEGDQAIDGEARSASLRSYKDILEALATNAPSNAGAVLHQEVVPPRLHEVIAASHSVGSLERRIDAVCGVVNDLKYRDRAIIVFCSQEHVADQVCVALRAKTDIKVFRHLADGFVATAFTHLPPPWVLVCDHRAEEGLNLQGKNRTVVHCDLPFAPNRVEQRIGRVDRYGVGGAVESIAIVCHDNPVEGSWAECLDRGLGVFDRSIASLQYFCSAELDRLWGDLLDGGEDAFLQMCERLAGPDGATAREFRDIRNFDALDAMHEATSKSDEEFEDMDCDWRAIDEALRGWACTSLAFKTEWEEASGIGAPGRPYRFEYDRRLTLIPFPQFLDHFLGAIDYESRSSSALHPKTLPYTARRDTAVHKGIPILRIGDPFVDELAAMTAYDDRGRSFAMWRYDQALTTHDVPKAYIKFEFVIEANIEFAETGSRHHTLAPKGLPVQPLRRKADTMFPPFFMSIWLDEELAIVRDKNVLSHLLRPYRRDVSGSVAKDFNLNPNRWYALNALRLPILQHWEDHCRAARERAKSILIESSGLENKCRHAVGAAQRDLEHQQSRLLSRSTFVHGHDAAYERDVMEFERDLIEHLIVGIEKPNVRIDSVGAVFLAATNPFGANGGKR